ncbi:MAG: N-acetyl-gamma-glutamyl-phosphate reductase [Candidatus Brocadiaceae bacterium]|jgi:N-acetyl-gamma-glutamyl-phosphate reductase
MMKIGIVGATAYTSRELIKILARHPEAELVHLGGRREGNPRISEVFPDLAGICEMRLSGLQAEDAPEKPDVAFFTLPHGVAHRYVPEYLAAGVRCIDFSADYRLDDLGVYEAWYGEHGDPDNVERAAYGIPELFREPIASADLVANPGCYPTGVALALVPFVHAGLIDPTDIVVDAKSGVSGRGNKPSVGSMYCECNEDVRAYSVTGHRHQPEMERALRLAGAADPKVTFVPHLVPMDRGILSTVFVRLTRDADDAELHGVLVDFYAGEPFIRVRSAEDQPRTKAVAFSNYCDLAAVSREGGRAVLTAAIDNLMKGAASQAVQNMNVACGLEETLGLL